ncbi:MAG: GntR family transcriptional regulator, partial [Planctomycetes bacterium]|nr:GntR family transcriptional regulator [Planctomycetota bacterium]
MTNKTNGPIYQEIQEHLQSLVESGELKAGAQVPSERKLMAQFQTSNMPVRQAIQHFIHKGIFERIHGRGTFVCANITECTNRIAVLYVYDNVGMWGSPFYMDILRGIEQTTLAEDKRLILQSVGDNDIYSTLRKLEDDVDGFIIVDLFPSMVERVEKYIREKRKKVVVANYPHNWSNCQAVVSDNIHNSLQLTQHLIEHGHQQIAFLTHRSRMGDMHELHPSSNLKKMGYRQALELNDIRFDD